MGTKPINNQWCKYKFKNLQMTPFYAIIGLWPFWFDLIFFLPNWCFSCHCNFVKWLKKWPQLGLSFLYLILEVRKQCRTVSSPADVHSMFVGNESTQIINSKRGDWSATLRNHVYWIKLRGLHSNSTKETGEPSDPRYFCG